MERVYLDHAATSPLHPSVIRAMTSAMESTFGNPSSIHAFGREARRLVDEARSMAARSIGADFEEIVFTSGGTEADNLAIIGTALANANRGKHIITTAIEHHAVLHACEFLESKGFEVTYLPVDASGVVSSREVYAALRDDTILVTIMTVNNEVGTIQPIAEIGSLLKDHPAYFHTDAVQGFGLLPIDVREWNVDLLSVSSHKINGPKGIGFLYIKNGVRISPLFYGGQQERKRRAGTENVPSLAGFAEAIRIVLEERKGRDQKYRRFADRFCAILEKGGSVLNVTAIPPEPFPIS
jgi:Aminotransferase class-V.